MSFDLSWTLPFRELDRRRVETAMTKVLRALDGASLGDGTDPDLADPSNEYEDDEDDDGAITFHLQLAQALVAEHAEDESELDDEHGVYSIELQVIPGDDDSHASITVSSGDAENESCAGAIGEIAGRLSALLGGKTDCDPN